MRLSASCIALACLLTTSPVSAQSLETSDFIVGTTVRPITSAGRDYVIADIPMADGMFRLSDKPVFATFNYGLAWGVKGGFSVDPSLGAGLRWDPVTHLSLFAKGQFGTFVFNNYTLLGAVGADVAIPIGNEGLSLVVGAEYFGRRVRELAGFIDKPQWYASGNGVGIRFGLRMQN